MRQKALVIGGFGFLGSYIAEKFQNEGLDVTIGHRKKEMPDNEQEMYLDLSSISQSSLEQKLVGFDCIVFAGGLDDRHLPKGKIKDYFYSGNVTPCVRLAQACHKLMIPKFIILGSYFTYFDRVNPHWDLAIHHEYIKSRVQQQQETLAIAGPSHIIFLEIPYVFGYSKNKTSLWKPLMNYIKKSPVIFYMNGGTNIISVNQFAQAVLGSYHYIGQENIFVVGGVNISWKALIYKICKQLEIKKKIIILPNFLIRWFAWIVRFWLSVSRRSSGLDAYHFIKVQTSHSYLDPSASQEALNYGQTDIDQAIHDTLQSC